MSQRTWKTETGVEVLTGWDRPLQHFFLTIIDGETEDGEDNILFCNLDHYPFPGGMTLKQVKEKLYEFDIPRPVELLSDLSHDQAINAGNVLKNYGVVKSEN